MVSKSPSPGQRARPAGVNKPVVRPTALTASAARRKAMQALDEMVRQQYELIRWRLMLANMPPTGTAGLRKRALLEIEERTVKLNAAQATVWRAIGYDPETDGPAPKTHWDKSAMEDN